MTIQGLLLACTLGVMGYIAAPMVACPPEEEKKQEAPEPVELVVPTSGADRAEFSPEPEEDGLTTFEQFMLQQNGEEPEPDEDTQQDIEDIEKRIHRLQERIGELLESIDAPAAPDGLYIEVPHAPMLESEAIVQDALRSFMEGFEIEFDDCTPSRARRVSGCRDDCTPSRARRVTRHYDDCTPSRARRVIVYDDCTPNRGNVLSFSVSSQDGDDSVTRAYYLSRGKLKDLTRLMARSDVPVWITRHSDRIEVQGTPAQHRVFEAFVRLIETGDAGGATIVNGFTDPVNLTYMNAIEARANRGCSVADVPTVERQVRQYIDRSRMYRDQSREIQRHSDRLRRQAERVREQAERLREQLEQQREEIESVENRARDLDDLARFNLMNEAHVLLASSHTVQSESNRLAAYADMLERQADSFSDQADNVSDQSHRYEDLASELRDLADRYRERETD